MMPDFKDFLPAEPPLLPLPRGLLKKLEIGEGYYGALVGQVFKKYLRKEITYDQFLRETKEIERMFEEERK